MQAWTASKVKLTEIIAADKDSDGNPKPDTDYKELAGFAVDPDDMGKIEFVFSNVSAEAA